MNDAAFDRLEAKVDKLTDAVTQLVRVEERQMTHGTRITALEVRVTTSEELIGRNERELAKWVNRGIGIWGLAGVAWTIYTNMRSGG